MQLLSGNHPLYAGSAAGSGAVFGIESHDWSVVATVQGSGAVAASVEILVSNDGVNFLTLATITLNGTNTDTEGFPSTANYAFVQAVVTSLTGTSIAVWINL